MGQPTVLFHPIHAPGPEGMLFDSDDLPNLDYGWVTDYRNFPDPKKIPKEHKVPLEVAVAARPKTEEEIAAGEKRVAIPTLAGPDGFESLEAYMEEFDSRLSTDLTTEQREEQHKRAVQHYAIVRYNHPLDGQVPLVDMVNDVDLKEQKARESGDSA